MVRSHEFKVIVVSVLYRSMYLYLFEISCFQMLQTNAPLPEGCTVIIHCVAFRNIFIFVFISLFLQIFPSI
jgi:hypothetical protein